MLSQRPLPVVDRSETPLELHRWALDYVRSLDLKVTVGQMTSSDTPLLDAGPCRERQGDPEGGRRARVMWGGKAPEATLADAVAFYRKEKLKGLPDNDPKVQRVDRVVRYVVETIKRGPPTVCPCPV